MTTDVRHHEVVIVGAGFSGLGVAIELKKAGFADVLIVDDAADAGGVWHWNTYPGVAVDIPSFSYQFSYAQRTDWTRSYAKGAELKTYALFLVEKFGLASSLQLDTRVERATYDDAAKSWSLDTSQGPIQATFIVHAGGPLSQPKYPQIPGLESFVGDTMHTARWDHSVDLAGKRVAIIGTGASSVQIVPAIAPAVRHLTVFQRTAIWCMPKADFALGRAFRTGLARIPGLRQGARVTSNVYVEAMFPLIAHYNGLLHITSAVEPIAKLWLKSQVQDPVLREQLTPKYGLGCKRPSFHNSYLATFNRANVTLETDGIAAVTPTGVVTAEGVHHDAEVLLLATGFKVTEKDALPSYPVLGRAGRDLGDWWQENRQQAYQGVSVPAFPNFFTVHGPYGYNGSSFFAFIESTARHISRVLNEARKRGAAEVEVSAAAHQRFMEKVYRRRTTQVFWQASCGQSNSYYFDKHGDVYLRPGLTLEVRWSNTRFPLDDYNYSAATTVSASA